MTLPTLTACREQKLVRNIKWLNKAFWPRGRGLLSYLSYYDLLYILLSCRRTDILILSEKQSLLVHRSIYILTKNTSYLILINLPLGINAINLISFRITIKHYSTVLFVLLIWFYYSYVISILKPRNTLGILGKNNYSRFSQYSII